MYMYPSMTYSLPNYSPLSPLPSPPLSPLPSVPHFACPGTGYWTVRNFLCTVLMVTSPSGKRRREH